MLLIHQLYIINILTIITMRAIVDISFYEHKQSKKLH